MQGVWVSLCMRMGKRSRFLFFFSCSLIVSLSAEGEGRGGRYCRLAPLETYGPWRLVARSATIFDPETVKLLRSSLLHGALQPGGPAKAMQALVLQAPCCTTRPLRGGSCRGGLGDRVAVPSCTVQVLPGCCGDSGCNECASAVVLCRPTQTATGEMGPRVWVDFQAQTGR